jgi:hypothetical protein
MMLLKGMYTSSITPIRTQWQFNRDRILIRNLHMHPAKSQAYASSLKDTQWEDLGLEFCRKLNDLTKETVYSTWWV